MDTEDQKVFLNLIAETRERSKLICGVLPATVLDIQPE